MSNLDRNAAPWSRSTVRTGAEVDQGLRAFMLGVYNNMTIGLALTGLVALATNMLAVSAAPTIYHIGHVNLTALGSTLYLSPLRWVIMFAPLGFVMLFTFKAGSMTSGAARALFFAFAALMGLSLSSILLIYTGASVATAFFITAASFGGLSLYGYTTKRDLGPMGAFMAMGLVGLVIASVVNLFVQSSGFQFGLSILSILIFAGLTARDTQAIKSMYYERDSYESATKKSVNGALMLYLDFVNIFLSVLQLTGSRD